MTSRLGRQLYCRCGTHLVKDNTSASALAASVSPATSSSSRPKVLAEFWQTDQFRMLEPLAGPQSNGALPASDISGGHPDDPERDLVLVAPWNHRGTVEAAAALRRR